MSSKINIPIKPTYDCRICGGLAEYKCFGVFACHPCKIFFKRNANTGQKISVCRVDGQCEINVNSRHVCSACRLAKCFQCGMKTENIQCPRQGKPKLNALARRQASRQPERLPTLNLLQEDQSTLTIDQWTLLSNLCNCYNESRISPFIQRLVDADDASNSTYLKQLDEFLLSIYETAGEYLRLNSDIRNLSSNDRSITLYSAANNLSCAAGSFIMDYFQLHELSVFLRSMSRKYGSHTMDIHMCARKFIDADVILIKLAISLFAFSENTSFYDSNALEELTNPIHILEIQNKYAELTWKYLLYKYGFHESVKRFLNLTLWLSSLNILAHHAQSVTIHVNDIDSIVEQTELNLVLEDIEAIVETNYDQSFFSSV